MNYSFRAGFEKIAVIGAVARLGAKGVKAAVSSPGKAVGMAFGAMEASSALGSASAGVKRMKNSKMKIPTSFYRGGMQ